MKVMLLGPEAAGQELSSQTLNEKLPKGPEQAGVALPGDCSSVLCTRIVAPPQPSWAGFERVS